MVLLKYAAGGIRAVDLAFDLLGARVPQRGHSILPVKKSRNDIFILLQGDGFPALARRGQKRVTAKTCHGHPLTVHGRTPMPRGRRAFRGTVGENEPPL